MNRETKTLDIGNHKIVVNTYLTGREVRDIDSALMDKLEIRQVGKSQEISGLKGSMLKEQEDMQIKAVVVSIDGSSDNIVDRLIDLPHEQYQQVMQHIKIVVGKKEVPTTETA